MSNEAIKQKLKEVIDQLEDKEALEKMYADALAHKYAWMDDDPFTEDEWAQIAEGLAQVRNDEPCTHEGVLLKFHEWQAGK